LLITVCIHNFLVLCNIVNLITWDPAVIFFVRERVYCPLSLEGKYFFPISLQMAQLLLIKKITVDIEKELV